MPFWNELKRRARYFGRRSQFDAELGDEIQFHIETRAEELRSEGATPAAAFERARREFGPRIRMQEDSRAAWQFQWIEDLWRDLVYGARSFAKSPGFTAVAILSLGIGVGANYVMFTTVDEALLRPPKIPRANEVVAVVSTARDSNAAGVSYPDYLAVRDRSHSFESLTAFTAMSTGFAAHPGAVPHVKDGKLVAGSFFDVLGAKPEMGRPFLPEEDTVPGKDLVAILSHACWQDDFGADSAVLGKQARINGIDFTIVGVMPARFTGVDDDLSDDNPSFYLPILAARRVGGAPELVENRGQRTLTVFGRLKRGISVDRARAEIATIASTLERDYPDTNRDRSMLVRTVLEFRSGGSGGITAASLAMTLAGLVLLVACANIAGLLTSRAPARAQEIAMRLAIGAGRARLIRQLLTESLLLAVGGAAAGITIGYIPIALAKQLASQFDPSFAEQFPFALDTRLLVFSIMVALLSVVLFGLMPAIQATRADLTSVMKGAGGQAARRSILGRIFRGRNILVTGQVAIALLVLTVTTMLYTSVYKSFVSSVRNPGFRADHLLAIDFDPPSVHPKDAAAQRFFKDLVAHVRSTKGVNAATVVYQDVAVIRPESPLAHDDAKASGVWIDEGFFDTLGIPILRGRGFRASDIEGAPTVAIVNEELAHRYWPDQNAIGKRLRLSAGQWVEIVGVAKLSHYMAYGIPALDTILLPYGTPKQRDIRLVARSTADPHTLIEPVRAMIRDLDPDQAMPEAHAVQDMFVAFERGAWLGMNTFGAMGVLALLLALVGLYGLLAYEVNARTREIGIRMALGARAGAVVRMVLRQGIALAMCGIGAGVALNYGVLKLMAAILGGNGAGVAKPPEPNGGNEISVQFGTAQFGKEAFAILVIAVFVVTILAAYLPARRAARVDPNVALRAE